MHPIIDTLTRIKNSYHARHDHLVVPFSRLRFQFLALLKEQSFIKDVTTSKNGSKKKLEITLRYVSRRPALTDFKTISKSSQRIYAGYRGLTPNIRGGIVVVSTSNGLLPGEEARKKRVGGEVLCEVW